MNRFHCGATALLSLIAATAVTASAQIPPSNGIPSGAIQQPAESMQWRGGTPSRPPGTKIMVLEGNPTTEGFFTIRLKVPAGTVLPPHWHPRDERVTVLSGTVRVGFGDRVDESATTTFGAGSFYLNPPNSHHFVIFPEESVVQLTGVGPWELHIVGEE
jgi:quercetin dioxygenase-like cupin family protein